jgi:hypothetical protein
MAEATSDAQLLQRWPAYAWALNIPDLKAVLADPNITDPGEIQAKIEATNWWKNTAPAQRNWTARQAVDPSGAKQDLGQKAADIWDQYLSVGLKPNVNDVNDLANQALAFGWTDTQTKDAIVSHMQYSPEAQHQIGSVQTTAAQLKQQASQYYIGLDDQTAFQWSKSIAAGESKAEDYIPQLQQAAKSKYAYSPEINKAIDAGSTVAQFFAPYKQEAAKLLETTPDAIDFQNNPQWSDVTQYADPKTGEHRLMTISELQRKTRGMDAFATTNQAKQQTADLGESLLKEFGVVA